jgi:hypothetical protein
MNKLIEIQDLQVGDEIIVPVNSKFRYFKVLREVKVRTKGRTTTSSGKSMYKAVWVSTKKSTTPYTRTWGGTTYNYTSTEYEITDKDHNHEGYVDLNYKSIWLVKR